MSSPTDDYQNYEDYEDYSDYLPNNRDFKVSGSGRKPPTERRTFTMPELRQRFPELNVINEPSINEIARLIQEGKAKRIVVMTGAGISTAAGIPDFRSPGTGLYHNLQKYNLKEAEDIFDIEYFQENPYPFFVLAKELYPGNYKPTLTHYFIKLLAQKQLLLRNFTQNIDTLERVAEIDEDYLVEAHGSFATARCIRCTALYDPEDIKRKILGDSIPKCKSCDGLVKPDIVFFGEGLPDRFYDLSMSDLSKADLLIVIGTSLQVAPFCTLINRVSRNIPRLLINMTRVGENIYGSKGFDFDGTNQKYRRDALYLGTCDDGCLKLAQLLGWENGNDTNQSDETIDDITQKLGNLGV
ncbi:DHS-like NAD/FAD-binding domain-containing protein [Paraphysoderma sedebokerense]|nr:DHS-like NAD/FAD-binding domain-containing protein [Paraphysoderma sedebokerense]